LSYEPIPIPCNFLDEAESIGAFAGNKRWKYKKRYYEWDRLHGEIEIYDKRGWHLGVADCNGNIIKNAVKGRKIDV